MSGLKYVKKFFREIVNDCRGYKRLLLMTIEIKINNIKKLSSNCKQSKIGS